MLQNLSNVIPTRNPRKVNRNVRLISSSASETGFYVTVVFRGGRTKTFHPSQYSIGRFFDLMRKLDWHVSIEYHNGLTWHNYFNPALFDRPRVIPQALVIYTSSEPTVIPNV